MIRKKKKTELLSDEFSERCKSEQNNFFRDFSAYAQSHIIFEKKSQTEQTSDEFGGRSASQQDKAVEGK